MIDDSISVDEVMRGFIRPEIVEERPALVPLALEWPAEIVRSTTEELRVEYGGVSWPLVDADLRITEFSDSGPIPFRVSTPDWTAEYEARMGYGEVRYTAERPRWTW